MLLSSFVKEKHCEVDNVFPSSLELNGGLFNQREGASIATRQRVCVSVCVCPPTVQQPVYVEPVCMLFCQQKKPPLSYF